MALAKCSPLPGPVHGPRAKGFNHGETYFHDITETVTVYCAAIRKQQPLGPYAIAGYYYGSMLAVEIAKVLEHNGSEVHFVGCFNLPPHIKFRMQQLDWTDCLLHLSCFLDLISSDICKTFPQSCTGFQRKIASLTSRE